MKRKHNKNESSRSSQNKCHGKGRPGRKKRGELELLRSGNPYLNKFSPFLSNKIRYRLRNRKVQAVNTLIEPKSSECCKAGLNSFYVQNNEMNVAENMFKNAEAKDIKIEPRSATKDPFKEKIKIEPRSASKDPFKEKIKIEPRSPSKDNKGKCKSDKYMENLFVKNQEMSLAEDMFKKSENKKLDEELLDYEEMFSINKDKKDEELLDYEEMFSINKDKKDEELLDYEFYKNEIDIIVNKNPQSVNEEMYDKVNNIKQEKLNEDKSSYDIEEVFSARKPKSEKEEGELTSSSSRSEKEEGELTSSSSRSEIQGVKKAPGDLSLERLIDLVENDIGPKSVSPYVPSMLESRAIDVVDEQSQFYQPSSISGDLDYQDFVDDADEIYNPSVEFTSGFIDRNYERAFKKLSLTQYDNLSPIKQSEANLRPYQISSKVIDLFYSIDPCVNGMTWIINMTEQFHYDNSLMILKSSSLYPYHLRQTLRASVNPKTYEYYQKYWLNIEEVGSGSFGNVYKVFDDLTKEKYAVKIIKCPKRNSLRTHRRILMDFLLERNYLIKARGSQSIVQFYFSAQLPNSSYLMLVFEYCVSDLWNVYKELRRKYTVLTDDASEVIAAGSYDHLPNMYKLFQNYTKVNIYEIAIIHIFEMCCALDFLARCNIIHRDIKPENIMISSRYHLKIADFGLIYNTFVIARESQIHLVKHSDIDKAESSNYVECACGTFSFIDVETALYKLVSTENPKFWKEYKGKLITNRLAFKPLQDFMSDAFAMALTMCYVLFLGDRPFQKLTIPVQKMLKIEYYDECYIQTVKIFGVEEHFEYYVKERFMELARNKKFTDLIVLIETLLEPREIRGQPLTSFKKIRLLNGQIRRLAFLDINKVETLSLFATRNLTEHTVHFLDIDKRFGILFKEQSSNKRYQNFQLMMDSLKTPTARPNLFNLMPGTHFDI